MPDVARWAGLLGRQVAAARFAARVTIERKLDPADAHAVLALAQAMPEAPESLDLQLRRHC